VWTLSRLGTPAARIRLCQTSLVDPDPSVRQAAVHAAGILREPAAVPALRQIVVEGELPIRREAATALGLIGDPDAVPALCDSLSTAKDEFLEHALIYALIEIGQAPLIRAWLGDENPRVQRGVLIALDQIAGDALTREDVAPLLATTDAELQRVALDVIAQHPTWAEEIIDLLRDALVAKELTSARRAVVDGAVAAFSENEKVQSLVAETLSQSSTPAETLSALLEAIGRIERPQLPASWSEPLGGLLTHLDPDVRRQLLASLIPFEAAPLHDPLRRTARNMDELKELRVAALGLVARSGAELADSELQLLLDELHEDAAPAGRLVAANALSTANLTPDQLQQLLPVVRRSGPLEISALLRAYALAAKKSKLPENEAQRIGMALIAALGEAPGRESLAPNRLHAVFADFPPEVAAAVRQNFPESQAANEEQLEKIRLIEAEADEGNLDAGKLLFFSNRLACAGCHRISGKGGAVGPDLSQIGKVRSTRHLAEAVLLPSATLANGFESYTLATHAGRTLTGLIRRESASAIHLVSTDGAEIRVPRGDIAEIQPSDVSIMPQGLDKQLTHEQLRDLVAFLRSLQ
jgi:putative heme-binding domain-containing protein